MKKTVVITLEIRNDIEENKLLYFLNKNKYEIIFLEGL